MWESAGIDEPTRDQVRGAVALTPGTFRAYVGRLISVALIEARGVGIIALTPAGREAAPAPDTSISVRDRIGRMLGPGEARILDALPRDASAISRGELQEGTGLTPGTFRAYLGRLIGLRLVRSEGVGMVSVAPWVWS